MLSGQAGEAVKINLTFNKKKERHLIKSGFRIFEGKFQHWHHFHIMSLFFIVSDSLSAVTCSFIPAMMCGLCVQI